MKNILSISSLSIGYNKNKVLSNISLDIDQPKLITLIGRNGQGKSTLLKTLSGLIPAIDGEIFFGEKINKELNHKEKSKLFSVVLTSPPAINSITVKDFVAYGRYPYTNWLAQKKEEDNRQINQAMELCGITNFAATNIANLSDGERQKVALARAIAQNTPIIFLDEPTSHLDLVNQSELFDLLDQLVEKQQKTIIISSHQLNLALNYADEIWLINNNQLEANTPEYFIKSGKIEALFGGLKLKYF
ncbi:MAG: ABC transporter ATP-binding protein [Vicingaceae bacterium]|nr:ABC transporter ATP-binding protein [Vicingaceae bacterium]